MVNLQALGEIRKEFPITEVFLPVGGGLQKKPLIYFDHAATTHPPRRVLQAHTEFLEHHYANIHRGNHALARLASKRFDEAVLRMASHIGGDLTRHAILITSNTTEALNLASHLMAPLEGITLCTWMEHHSNDLPHRKHGPVEYVDLLPDGTLDMNDLEKKLKTFKVKLVAVTGASNVTGVLPDIHRIAETAHAFNARILVDAAQLLAHEKIDAGRSRIDFLAAAGHKAYAPFGAAFLYAPSELLCRSDSFLPGGGTVIYVTHDEVKLKDSSERHEGGTPNIAGTVALGEALKFLQEIGMEIIREHEKKLCRQALEGLSALEGITVYGPLDPEKRLGVLAFNVTNLSHEKVSALLNDEWGIASRNGSFCAQPYLLRLLGIRDLDQFKKDAASADSCTNETLPGAVRISFGLYNTEDEVEKFLKAVKEIRDSHWKDS